jgi:hypothetical protein
MWQPCMIKLPISGTPSGDEVRWAAIYELQSVLRVVRCLLSQLHRSGNPLRHSLSRVPTAGGAWGCRCTYLIKIMNSLLKVKRPGCSSFHAPAIIRYKSFPLYLLNVLTDHGNAGMIGSVPSIST